MNKLKNKIQNSHNEYCLILRESKILYFIRFYLRILFIFYDSRKQRKIWVRLKQKTDIYICMRNPNIMKTSKLSLVFYMVLYLNMIFKIKVIFIICMYETNSSVESIFSFLIWTCKQKKTRDHKNKKNY